MKRLPIISLLLSLAWSSRASPVYCIKDSSPHNYQGQPCLTLEQYAQQPTSFFTDNATFLFSSGSHNARTAINLTNVSNIILKGEGTNVSILCETEFVLQCEGVSNLTVTSLNFLHSFNKVSKETSILVLRILNSSNILVNETTFIGSNASFATAMHVEYSELALVQCKFEQYTGIPGGIMRQLKVENIKGGAILSQDSVLNISGSIFLGNSMVCNDSIIESYGGAIYMLRSHLNLEKNNIFGYNSACFGGATSSLSNPISAISVTTKPKLGQVEQSICKTLPHILRYRCLQLQFFLTMWQEMVVQFTL